MDKALIVIVVVALLVIVGPLLTIWALNTLFPVLNIPYSLETWFASLLLGGIFHASSRK